jgi:hypothetical protein
LLNYYLAEKNLYGQYSAINRSKKLLEGIKVNKTFGFHEVNEAIEYYKKNMTDGKVYLSPNATK